jgi:WD40 repeat protein
MDKMTEPDNTIHSVHYSHTAEHFVTCGADKSVRLYDATMNECVTAWGPLNDTKQCHSNQVFCVRFHPSDHRIIVSGGWDSNVKVWDARQPAPIRTLFGPHISGRGLAINQKNQILTASDTNDNSLQLWDFRSTRKLADIHWTEGGKSEDVIARRVAAANDHSNNNNNNNNNNNSSSNNNSNSNSNNNKNSSSSSSSSSNNSNNNTKAEEEQKSYADDDDRPNPTPHLYCCAFSPDDTMFAAGGTRPAEAAVFDSRTFEKLSSCTLEPSVHTLDFSSDQTNLQLVVGGSDNAVSLYKIE